MTRHKAFNLSCAVFSLFLLIIPFHLLSGLTVSAAAEENGVALIGKLAHETSSAKVVSITSLVESDVIDMGAPGIHPLPAPLASRGSSGAGSPDGTAVGKGKAFTGITTDIVNHSTTNAYGVLSSNWTPAENVQLYLKWQPRGNLCRRYERPPRLGVKHSPGFRLHDHRRDRSDERKRGRWS